MELKKKEIKILKVFLSKGLHKSQEIMRANILLLLNKNKTGVFISKNLSVSPNTVSNIKNRYREGGLKCLYDKPRSGQPRKYTDKHKAEIVATACTNPPEGRKRWSLQLLTEELKKREGMKTINAQTIRLVLKKTKLSHG